MEQPDLCTCILRMSTRLQTPGKVPGDVIFVLKQRQDDPSGFHRSGDDLEMTYKISLEEALLGFETELTHLDGHKVQAAHAAERMAENLPHRNTQDCVCCWSSPRPANLH